ncbi:MAG: imidazole glycerol phosphate synthase subunit HisH [Saprospiraceae bacterium]
MIAIVDYNAGNTCSVINALERLGIDHVLTADSGEIYRAEKVILPGVGHAKAAMDQLKKRKLRDVLKSIKNPFLGICVGMQIMAKMSTEGPTEALDIVDTTVQKFEFDTNKIKIPHMGWNRVNIRGNHPIFEGIEDNSYLYFVHSYYMPINKYTICTTEYGTEYSAGIVKNNFIGVQFHPEKSGAIGERLLKNFVEL